MEFKNYSNEELAKKLADLKAELFNLRFSHATGSLSNPKALTVCKKQIAQVKTIIRERELGLSIAPVVAKASGKKEDKVEKSEAAKVAPVKAKAAVAAKKPAAKKEKADKIMV